MLTAEGVSYRVGAHTLLEEVTLELNPGEILGLIGPNGAGKSTLANLLAGLTSPASGSVVVDERDLQSVPMNQRARKIAYLPQHPSVHWSLTVADVVALGRIPHVGRLGRHSAADTAAIKTAIERTELSEFTDRRVDELSGGEMMRVMIARLLAVDAAYLIVDEPITGLDPYYQLEVLDLFRAEARRGCAALLVLHDLSLAARYCDRVALLQHGQLVAVGQPADVLTEARIESVYRVAMDNSKARHFVPYRRL